MLFLVSIKRSFPRQREGDSSPSFYGFHQRGRMGHGAARGLLTK